MDHPLALTGYSYALFRMHDAASARLPFSAFLRQSFPFPAFLCGPIALSGQTWPRNEFMRPRDAWLICAGLCKILILLPVWNLYMETGVLLPWRPDLAGWSNLFRTGLYRYAQLYLDFSGATDVAVGLAGLMGLRIRHNFRRPWLAVSVSDFWRRWHITLGAWMRRHVYIPSGRGSAGILLVFVLVGAWHGLRIHFILWGLIHAAAILIERRWLSRAFRRAGGKHPVAVRWSSVLLTQTFICLSWVVFFWP